MIPKTMDMTLIMDVSIIFMLYPFLVLHVTTSYPHSLGHKGCLTHTVESLTPKTVYSTLTSTVFDYVRDHVSQSFTRYVNTILQILILKFFEKRREDLSVLIE